MSQNNTLHQATMLGFGAIPIWASLPTLTIYAGAVPPLQLVALTFTLGTFVGVFYLALSPASRSDLRKIQYTPFVLGVVGLFGYHFAYFLALQNAPAVEASLVNYLWPVLIVLFSAALPSWAGAGKLTLWHVGGAFIAFAGAAIAISSGDQLSFAGNSFGYGMALAAALIWAAYSVTTRLFQGVPSSAVTLYCAGTAVLAWIAHFVFESTVVSVFTVQAAAIVALGLGPVGLAFYLWDYGCKQGDIRVLGVMGYFTPILSLALLMLSGIGSLKPVVWLSGALITAGALLASKDFILRGFSAKRSNAKP